MDESSSSSFSEESSTYASSASSNGKVCVQTVAEKSDFCDGTSQTGVLRPAGCEMKDASAAPKMGDKTHRYKFDRACTPRSEYEVKNKLKKVKHAEGFIERMEGSCDFYYDDKGNRNENGIDYEKTWDERGFQVIAPKRGFCNPFKK
jgi:hypothetical protein